MTRLTAFLLGCAVGVNVAAILGWLLFLVYGGRAVRDADADQRRAKRLSTLQKDGWGTGG